MTIDTLAPEVVLAEWKSGDLEDLVQMGITAARASSYERGLIFLAEAYHHLSRDQHRLSGPLLSYYGLCLALHRGRIREAAEFCGLGVEKDRYNADVHHNMARVWMAGRSRRKAVESLERGLALDPKHTGLLLLRRELGARKTPVLPFLHRDNPLNISLGRLRARMKEQRKTAASLGPGRGASRGPSRPAR